MASKALAFLCTLPLLSLASPPLQIVPVSELSDQVTVPVPFAGVRLPEDVSPVHYDIRIRPIVNLPLDDPEQFTAPGEATIRLLCLQSTSSITFHSSDIDIDHDRVTVKYLTTPIYLRVTGHSNDSSVATYTIDLESPLEEGIEYELYIPFISKVGDRLAGLYRSSYLDASGTRKWLATTQFQKLGARMAFPCWDEPTFKSTFNITLGRPAGYNSLTNGKRIDSVPIPGMPNWFWDSHETTVLMPSYLIAIIVSDFVSVDANSGIADFDVKIWGPPTMTDENSAEFSAVASAQITSFFANYLAFPYPSTKLDSAAVPDFAPGAMENFFMVIYRTVLLLFYEGESTQMEKWKIADVIAHELSHQWFGDIVTCRWWNDIWLNEGFASYMSNIGANATGVDFGGLDRYTIDKIQPAMEFDAGPNTEPVRSNVTDEVTNQAGRIIYEKAASLIRMMQSFLGEATFIGGIQNYVDKHAYNTTVQDQLFEELQAQAIIDGTNAPFTVKEIMDSWTLSTGFPILTVSYAGSGNLVTITQEKFVLDPSLRGKQQDGDLWYVPITYATKSDPDFSETNWRPKTWMDKSPAIPQSIEGAETDWVIVNPDARSYYRVIYDSHFFPLISAQLVQDHSLISLSSRSQLIDDYFKSAWVGYVSLDEALELTKYLETETSNTVWTTVLNNIRQSRRLLLDSPVATKFGDYFLSKISGALDLIRWEQSPTDAPVSIILRAQLLDWVCSLGSPQCQELTEMYATGLAEGSPVPADVQPMIYCKGINMNDQLVLPNGFSLKSYAIQQYMQATRAERHNVFINAMACDAAEYLPDWLRLATSPTSVVRNHAVQLIQRFAENPDHRETVISYFQENLAAIIDSLGENAISSLVSTIASYTSDSSVSSRLNELIDDALAVVTSGSVRQSLMNSRSQLGANLDWVSTWAPIYDSWLSMNLKH